MGIEYRRKDLIFSWPAIRSESVIRLSGLRVNTEAACKPQPVGDLMQDDRNKIGLVLTGISVQTVVPVFGICTF